MAKLPAHMKLVSMTNGEAKIQIDWYHPEMVARVTRQLALIAVTRFGRN